MTDARTAAARALRDAAWREADLMQKQLRREIPGLRADSYMVRQGNRWVESTQVAEAMERALAGLSRELVARGSRATLLARGGRWRPSLVVSNPEAVVRTSEIIAESGWYWWPGGRGLSDVTEQARAARLIVHALHVRCDCR
jgi:hypothetical protein